MFPNELPGFFKSIGASLEVHGYVPRRFGQPLVMGDAVGDQPRFGGWRPPAGGYTLDIRGEGRSEHFRLDVGLDAPDFRVLQAKRDERHLLLYATKPGKREDTRLLCGHDERHWFVAAVGEPVSTVMAARRALLPPVLRHKGLNKTTLTTRHNEAFKRQGEWFFVPVTDPPLLEVLATLPIHQHEPIQRGTRAKPHRCEQLVRTGGTRVYLAHGSEYSEAQWAALDPAERGKMGRVEERTKDMTVYVRGKIQHPDHATILLHGWHSVYMNSEIVSSNVTFYD